MPRVFITWEAEEARPLEPRSLWLPWTTQAISKKETQASGVEAHECNLSSWGVDVEGSRTQGHSQIQIVFKTILG